jgi:ATP-dependent DNA ligase
MPSSRKARSTNTSRVKKVAGPATRPDAEFPPINLPVQPPYRPIEAKSLDRIPDEGDYLFEPKWNGFRGLFFVTERKYCCNPGRANPLADTFQSC